MERHVARLRHLEEIGEITSGYSESWYKLFEKTLAGLRTLAERHPYAPERDAWGHDVRNALFADYRILYALLINEVASLCNLLNHGCEFTPYVPNTEAV